MSNVNRRDFINRTATSLATTAALSVLPASIRVALAATPDFTLNCVSDPTASPYTPANIVVALGAFRNTNGTGCKALTNGTSNLAFHNAAYGSSVRADIVYGATGPFDALGACVVVKSGANANKGYQYYVNGTSARLAIMDGTGDGTDISGTTFNYTPAPGDTLSCTYDVSTGTLQGWVNGVVQSSATDTTYAAESLAAGFAVGAANLNASVIRSFSGTGVLSGSTLPLLFSDDFSSGDLTHIQNGISWANSAFTTVSSQNSNGGPYSLRFTYDSGSNAEQRFNLGSPLTELLITFDLYIPNGSEPYGGAAYTVQNVSPNNNKVLRLWRGDQTDGNDGYSSFWTKAGASTLRNVSGTTIARLIQEYGKLGGGVGEVGSAAPGEPDAGSYDQFITASDLGTWLALQFHIKAATAAGNDGVMETWKNGTKIITCSDLDIYPGSAAQNGFDFGYLLGWANSGFASTTYLFIDNVKIYGR